MRKEASVSDPGTLVVGAGLAGSATAMHLAERGERVTVVDPDLAGGRSSSELNAGGVRATWWQPVNVELCAHTIDFLRDHAEEVGMRQRGYLWLYPPERWEEATRATSLQNGFGRQVELLSPSDVTRRWPFLDRMEGVAGATFSPRDGLVNANAVKELYRTRARSAGAVFLDRRALVEADTERRVATLSEVADEDDAHALLEGGSPGGAREEMPYSRAVNAAGPWAATIAERLGYVVPCRAVRRQVSIVASRDVDLSDQGMIVDASDAYFHHEGGEHILAGYSPPGDPPGHRFDYDGRTFFEKEIWPRLAARSSALDRLEHVRGWAGLYELSPDNSALVGAAEGHSTVFEIHSFSGRGVMQSYAAALSLAELVLDGGFRTFPSTAALSGSRFATGRLVPEELHI